MTERIYKRDLIQLAEFQKIDLENHTDFVVIEPYFAYGKFGFYYTVSKNGRERQYYTKLHTMKDCYKQMEITLGEIYRDLVKGHI